MKLDRTDFSQTHGREISRRQAFVSIGAGVVALPVLSGLDTAAALAADDTEPMNRFPRMVHE